MGKVEIIDSDLQQAIQYSKAIQDALRTSYDKSNDLKSYVKSAKWSGSTRGSFEAYLDLITQYHKDMNNIMEKHTKALENLNKYMQNFEETADVRKVRSL
ncbi:hypothetical protein CON64_16260 [Bacillus pseudomycoides]|nr:hypothetical protein CON64_16260 [Bacillus pseudomycoides]